jgi:glutamate racemase
VLFLALIGYTAPGCRNSNEKKHEYGNRFLNQALNDPSDYYYFDFSSHREPDAGLPVGMFDSGTGGLTVLSAAVNLDKFDNSTGKYLEKGDGIKDFSNEEFIYFGDQANMPYGNYAGVNRTGFLEELALRDALFLLGNNYYRSGNDKKIRNDKQSVKLIVIACNTATAYAKDDIERMIDSAGSRLKVIGVIDAGVRGALATFKKDESGTIGVMATAGTVSSDGYLNAFRKLKDELGYTGTIDFVQHPGIGIAESIDEEPDYILRDATKPRKEYRGPSLSKEDLMIRRELTGIYRFDTLKNSLLCDYKNGICETMQLNSPENYMRYHLVTLCEKLRETPGIKPMKTLILGCTHYPYLSDFISKTLDELYDVKINGRYIYRDVLADSITLVDPAINTAIEAFEYLSSQGLLNKKGDVKKSEFYISVPDMNNPAVKKDSLNCLTYDYKYNRDEGHFYDTKHVPVSRMNTNEEIRSRFARHIPEVFELIKIFDSENEKTSFLKPEDRF